jgi:hypothetical protein
LMGAWYQPLVAWLAVVHESAVDALLNFRRPTVVCCR